MIRKELNRHLALLERMSEPGRIHDNIGPETDDDEPEPRQSMTRASCVTLLLSRQQLNVAHITFLEKGYTHSDQVRWNSMFL